MKNTTKISLNERFTAYRQQAQSALGLVHAKVQQQRQASLRNLRLAQQMASRPSVIAALKLKKRSLKQRLGPTNGAMAGTPSLGVKSRLGPAALTGGSLHSRLGPRTGPSYTAVGGGGTRPGASPVLRSRLGFKTPQPARSYVSGGQGRRGRGFSRNFHLLPRGGGGGGNGFRGQTRRSSENASSRSTNGAGSRRGPWQGGGPHSKRLPNRDELDSQLDAYMAKTKNHLDAELDAYMAQSDL